RLVGPDGQQPAAARVKRACGQVEAGEVPGRRGQDPVVVEAVRGYELLAAQRVGSRGAVRDRREDRLQVPEVERGSPHRGDLAGRDQVGVGRREGVGVDLDV